MTIYAVNGKEPVAAWIPSLDTAGNGTTTLSDSVGSNNGTLTNMDAATDWVADTDNGGVRALDFDGSNDRVVATGIGITSSVFSVSLWVRRTIVGGVFPRFIDISDGTSTYQILSDDGSGGSGQLTTKHTQFQAGLTSTKWGTIGNGTWSHVVTVVNSITGTVSLYLNGVAVSGTAGGVTGSRPAANTLILGTRTDVSSITTLNGRLDDIRIWNQSLDATDAAYLYNSGNGRGRVGSTTIRRQQRSQQIIS